MNKIILKGIITNIQYSHNIGDIEYDKANLIVKRTDGKEDLLNIKFKRFSNPYKNGQEIELQGNVRTFSQKFDNNKSRVEVYVFTYFDLPDVEIENNNLVDITGKICKLNIARKTQSGKDVIDFIIANNLITESQSLNCYIPCVAWGKLAKILSKYQLGDTIHIKGQLQSREYKKKISDDDFEIRVAHELSINQIIADDIK